MERRLHDSAAKPGQPSRLQDAAGGVPARRRFCDLVWPSRCAASRHAAHQVPSAPLGAAQTADAFA